MKTKVALETLGCKVNQYESSYFLETLKEAGYEIVPFRASADIYIVHSCAVTSKAGFQTRQLLRRAARLNPEAIIVAAGCDAQVESQRLAAERLATHILGTAEKFDLLHWLRFPGSLAFPCRATGDPRTYHFLEPLPVTRMHTGRARAFLKVQDGCDAFCSYCIVPQSRGKSRSLPPEHVRSQVNHFLTYGYSEVVLTAVHLGQWGKDLSPAQDLTSLLDYLDGGPLPPRIRLSSLEPMEWTGALLKKLSAMSQICPHFHIPLQSGDEEILAMMHRPYSPQYYGDLIRELSVVFPGASLGADVLVGFPGETEKHFRNTYRLIRDLPLTHLHVFPFSPRPGTLVAQSPHAVNGQEIKRRAQSLQELGIQKRQVFYERFLGRSMEVLAENQPTPGWWQGTTRNYIRVSFPAKTASIQGALVEVRLTGSDARGLVGEPLGREW